MPLKRTRETQVQEKYLLESSCKPIWRSSNSLKTPAGTQPNRTRSGSWKPPTTWHWHQDILAAASKSSKLSVDEDRKMVRPLLKSKRTQSQCLDEPALLHPPREARKLTCRTEVVSKNRPPV
eukprot:3826434-Amphidinium_carterae.1